MRDRSRNRIRPREAWRAMRGLLSDPDDTSQVFRIVGALSGNSGERTYRRFEHSPVGRRVLRERRVLLGQLSDHDALRSLPTGSLGHRYAEFMEREQISGEGLAQVSEEARDPGRAVDPDRRLFFDRLRDMHDLWHVATGYDRDLLGEIALLTFSLAQTRNPGIAFIVGTVYLRSLRSGRESAPVRRMIRDGWRRGRRSEWLPAADWEALLAQPLARVREQLRLGPPPRYAEVRSAGAPPVPAAPS